MTVPAKDWKEIIELTEETEFEEYAKKMVEVQKKKSQVYGNGRGLHRKQIAALKGSFEVLDNIPDFAKFGLFAKPGIHETLFRISNGGMDIKSDVLPDIRGFSFKVLGVEGDSALGNGKVKCQDFTLINQSKFSFPKSKEFMGLVLSAAEGTPNVIFYMIKTFGLFGGIGKVIDSGKTFAKPFTGFGTETFHSAAPISCGPYACKVRIVPKQKQVNNEQINEWAVDLREKLTKSNLEYDFQLQFFINEKITPLENASVEWQESDSPFYTLAKILIPSQIVDVSNKSDFSVTIEGSVFDPWNGLIEHKPLGNIMRTRKYVYYASQKTRGAV